MIRVFNKKLKNKSTGKLRLKSFSSTSIAISAITILALNASSPVYANVLGNSNVDDSNRQKEEVESTVLTVEENLAIIANDTQVDLESLVSQHSAQENAAENIAQVNENELMECKEVTTPDALQQCASASLQLEEIRLNQSYQRLRQYIDDEDKIQLDSVQLAWLNYVDKSCQFEVRYLNTPQLHNDAEYQLRLNNCVQNYTHARRVELDNAFQYIMYRF